MSERNKCGRWWTDMNKMVGIVTHSSDGHELYWREWYDDYWWSQAEEKLNMSKYKIKKTYTVEIKDKK